MFFVLSVNQLQQLLRMVICIGPFLTCVMERLFSSGIRDEDRMLVCFFCYTCPLQLLRVKKLRICSYHKLSNCLSLRNLFSAVWLVSAVYIICQESHYVGGEPSLQFPFYHFLMVIFELGSSLVLV